MDQDTNDYKVCKLINKENDLEQSHSLIIKGFKEKKNNLIKIQTHKEVIGLEFIKAVGVMAFRFVQFEEDDTIGYTITLSKRQVNKLFGNNSFGFLFQYPSLLFPSSGSGADAHLTSR